MNKLYMMIGLPASGKSTIAKEISESEGAIIVSSDEIRKELLGDINDQSNNELVFKTVEERIIEGLKVGNVIYDATNINYKKRMAFLQKLNRLEVEKIAVLVVIPYEECLERNENRERTIPKEVITRMYHNFYVPQYFEGFDDIQIRFNTEIKFDRRLLFEKMDQFEQDNPHHKLTVGKHCRKCAKIIANNDCYNLLTIFAGMIHDIGKLNTKSFDNRHNDIEEWKEIAEFQNRYEVSNFGYIRNKKTKRILKGREHSGGYLQVNIINDGHNKNYYIHRIVAKYFCNDNNIEIEELDVNHIDGNKKNNFYKNLEWCNRSQNQKHAFYTNKNRNKFGTDVSCHKLSYEDVKKIRRIKKEEGLTNKEISQIYNINESQISRAINGVTYTNKIENEVTEIEPILPQRYASYYEHEKVGAYMSLFYTRDLDLINTKEMLYIAQLIQWHMLPWQDLSKKNIDKWKNRFGKEFWNDLMVLHKADKEAH